MAVIEISEMPIKASGSPGGALPDDAVCEGGERVGHCVRRNLIDTSTRRAVAAARPAADAAIATTRGRRSEWTQRGGDGRPALIL